jgi:hypothetical protein
MSAVTAFAARDLRQAWIRGAIAAGGAAAAAIGWAIEVPVLGIRLAVRFGTMAPETVVLGQVIGAAVVASLLGWLLLAVMERTLPGARMAWAGAAVAVLLASLALPAAAAVTVSAAAGLTVLHLAVAAVVIPGLASTARRPGR